MFPSQPGTPSTSKNRETINRRYSHLINTNRPAGGTTVTTTMNADVATLSSPRTWITANMLTLTSSCETMANASVVCTDKTGTHHECCCQLHQCPCQIHPQSQSLLFKTHAQRLMENAWPLLLLPYSESCAVVFS